MKTWRDVNDALRALGARSRTCDGSHIVWECPNGQRITTVGGGSGRQKRRAPKSVLALVRRQTERQESSEMARTTLKTMPHIDKVTKIPTEETLAVEVSTSRGNYPIRGIREPDGTVLWSAGDLKAISGYSDNSSASQWAIARKLERRTTNVHLGASGNVVAMVTHDSMLICDDTKQLAKALSGVVNKPQQTRAEVTTKGVTHSPAVLVSTTNGIMPEVRLVADEKPVVVPPATPPIPDEDTNVDVCLKNIRHWQDKLEVAIMMLADQRDAAIKEKDNAKADAKKDMVEQFAKMMGVS